MSRVQPSTTTNNSSLKGSEMVMGDTIGRPGGDAAVVRVHASQKAVAITCDVTPRYVAADPEQGHAQGDAETKPDPENRLRGNTRFGEKLE